MHVKTPFIFFLLILVLLLASCQSGDPGEALPSDPVSRGRILYEKTLLGTKMAPGCVTCHSLEPDVLLVGPSLAGIATTAASTVPGLTAEKFLRESIVEPDAHIPEGFVKGIMYRGYREDLTEEEIDDLVAFLMTLK